MPVPGTATHTSAGPRPPLADRLTPAQWLALDAVAAVLVALWVVFDLRLRHGAVAGRAPRLGLMRNGKFEDAL